MSFDYSLDFDRIDFRRQPEFYRIGRGEQGVFWVEPYKSELLPLWRFKTPEIAQESAAALYARYLRYKAEDDFVGMDMARKYLQMGYTRARRYANHKSGRKYDAETGEELPQAEDAKKAAAAQIFHAQLQVVKNDPDYIARRARHKELHERPASP